MTFKLIALLLISLTLILMPFVYFFIRIKNNVPEKLSVALLGLVSFLGGLVLFIFTVVGAAEHIFTHVK